MSNWKTADGVAETVMTYEEWKRYAIAYTLKKRVRRFLRRLRKNKRTIKSVIKGMALIGAIIAAIGCAGEADLAAENIRTADGYYANGFFFDYEGNYWDAKETWQYTYNESVRLQFDTKGTEDITDDVMTYVNEWNLPRFVGKTETYSDIFTVIGVSEITNLVTVENYEGNLYEFEGIEGWSIADNCTAVMSDNGTEYKQDDKVISLSPVEYCR